MKSYRCEDLKPHGKPMKQVTYKVGSLPVITGVILGGSSQLVNG